MRLFNPNDFKVEFIYGGKRGSMDPQESREFSEAEVEYILERFKAPLVKYHPIHDKKITKTDMDYDTMAWKDLVSLASARRLFKPGTPKQEVLDKLRDYDDKIRTLQESPDKEEGEGT